MIQISEDYKKLKSSVSSIYLKKSMPNPTTEVEELPTKDFEDGSFASPDVQITMCVVFSGKVI